MEYHKRGKNNPFDAYMAGMSVWVTPRQIIILSDFLKDINIDKLNEVEKDALLDFKSQIDYEAEIKRKKYL